MVDDQESIAGSKFVSLLLPRRLSHCPRLQCSVTQFVHAADLLLAPWQAVVCITMAPWQAVVCITKEEKHPWTPFYLGEHEQVNGTRQSIDLPQVPLPGSALRTRLTHASRLLYDYEMLPTCRPGSHMSMSESHKASCHLPMTHSALARGAAYKYVANFMAGRASEMKLSER